MGGSSWLSFHLLHHARRELDIQILDREFAGDKTGEKEIPGLFELLGLLLKEILLVKQRLAFFVEFLQQIRGRHEQLCFLKIIKARCGVGCAFGDRRHLLDEWIACDGKEQECERYCCVWPNHSETGRNDQIIGWIIDQTVGAIRGTD